MIAKRSVVRVLLHSHQLHAVVADILNPWEDVVSELSVGRDLTLYGALLKVLRLYATLPCPREPRISSSLTETDLEAGISIGRTLQDSTTLLRIARSAGAGGNIWPKLVPCRLFPR